MKPHERSSQRFVKEFANWKISILKDLAKASPYEHRAEEFKGRVIYIERLYKQWKNGLIMTTEVMELIAKA